MTTTGTALLDDGVVAVGLVRLDQAQGGVGDEPVMPVGREQLALLADSDPLCTAHDQPAGDVFGRGVAQFDVCGHVARW